MTYKINGTDITVQPTSGQWVEREKLAIDGNGHPIYPAVRQFVMNWNLSYPSHYYQLQNFFNSVGVTGTVVVSLPGYGFNSYTFTPYSGCVIHEPFFSNFFNEHPQDVSILITGIRT